MHPWISPQRQTPRLREGLEENHARRGHCCDGGVVVLGAEFMLLGCCCG